MGLLNSIFGNNELNDKIQELENSNLSIQSSINPVFSRHIAY